MRGETSAKVVERGRYEEYSCTHTAMMFGTWQDHRWLSYCASELASAS